MTRSGFTFSYGEYNGWTFAFGAIALVITATNLVTIFTFATSHGFKRKRPHYLLVNLAATDLLVGIIVIPLYVVVVFFPFLKTRLMSSIFTHADIILGLASVYSLTVISLERLYWVAKPFKHRLLTRKHYLFAVSLAWFIPIVARILLAIKPFNYLVLACFIIIVIFVPLLITLLSYIAIVVLRKRTIAPFQRGNNDKSNARLTKNLLILTAVFFLTWCPFLIVNTLYLFCLAKVSCVYISFNIVLFVKFLHYSNSFANPIVYVFRMPVFRDALGKRFCCVKRVRAVRKTARYSPNSVKETEVVRPEIIRIGLQTTMFLE